MRQNTGLPHRSLMRSYWFSYTGRVLIHPRDWDHYLSMYGACGTVTMRAQA